MEKAMKLNTKIVNINYLFNNRRLGAALRRTKEWKNITDMQLMRIFFEDAVICIKTTSYKFKNTNRCSEEEFLALVNAGYADMSEKSNYTDLWLSASVTCNTVYSHFRTITYAPEDTCKMDKALLTGVAAIEYLIEHCGSDSVKEDAYIQTIPVSNTNLFYRICSSDKRLLDAKKQHAPNLMINSLKRQLAESIDSYRVNIKEEKAKKLIYEIFS